MELLQFWNRVLTRFMTTKQRFTHIYKVGGFGGSVETVSGRGSLLLSTAHIREEIPALLCRHDVKTLLDAPCGDFNWMKEIVATGSMPGIRYIGADIVTDIVKSNAERYTTDLISFIEANIIDGELPAADMILCRDCFIHFSNADVIRTLQNFRRQGIRYILTNTFREISANKNISTGSWRQLNWPAPVWWSGLNVSA